MKTIINLILILIVGINISCSKKDPSQGLMPAAPVKNYVYFNSNISVLADSSLTNDIITNISINISLDSLTNSHRGNVFQSTAIRPKGAPNGGHQTFKFEMLSSNMNLPMSYWIKVETIKTNGVSGTVVTDTYKYYTFRETIKDSGSDILNVDFDSLP